MTFNVLFFTFLNFRMELLE